MGDLTPSKTKAIGASAHSLEGSIKSTFAWEDQEEMEPFHIAKIFVIYKPPMHP